MLKKNPGLKRDDAPRLPAGGLNVPTLESLGTPWIYGIVGAPALMSYLSRPRVGVVLAERLLDGDPTLDAALAKLEAGDAIGITPPEAKGVRRNFGHVVLYDGEGRVLCHTKCRKTARWNIAPEGARYTLVHILDEIDDRP